jgi:hypothetical protein
MLARAFSATAKNQAVFQEKAPLASIKTIRIRVRLAQEYLH